MPSKHVLCIGDPSENITRSELNLVNNGSLSASHALASRAGGLTYDRLGCASLSCPALSASSGRADCRATEANLRANGPVNNP